MASKPLKLKPRFKIWLVVLALVGAAALGLFAASIICDVSQDSYISDKTDKGEDDKNFGTDKEAKAKKNSGDNKYALFQFDLSGIPSGATIDSARVHLYVTGESAGDVVARRITVSWTETGVTYNNFWAGYDTTTVVRFSAPTPSVFTSFLLTDLVQDWVDGTYSNYGILLFSLANNDEVKFATINESVTDEHPYMTVYYTLYPDIMVVKSVQTYSDPVNDQTNPKAIPGAVMLYTVTSTNSGPGPADSDTVILIEHVPANSVLFVGDIDGAGSGPVKFTDGSPASGLTYTFTSLGSTTDDIEFSDDAGPSYAYDYTPVPDGDGYDSNVTSVKINPQGTFNEADGGDPSFSLQFKTKIQ